MSFLNTNVLHVKFSPDITDNIKNLYLDNMKNRRETDAGFDLFIAEELDNEGKLINNTKSMVFEPFETKRVSFGVMCETRNKTQHGFMLVPRSSIGKTKFRLSNSMGIIDYEYRGKLGAFIDNNSNKEQILSLGTRLFQVVYPNFEYINVKFVKMLSNTERGEKGFGSSDTQNPLNNITKPSNYMIVGDRLITIDEDNKHREESNLYGVDNVVMTDKFVLNDLNNSLPAERLIEINDPNSKFNKQTNEMLDKLDNNENLVKDVLIKN